MIALILLGASILSHATAFLGITQAISGWVTALNLSPIGLITILIGLYIVLGAFLDGFSMMVLTLPIVLPIVTAAGFDRSEEHTSELQSLMRISNAVVCLK